MKSRLGEFVNKRVVDSVVPIYRVVNNKGIIEDCTKSYCDILGYTKKEIMGKSIVSHATKSEKKKIKKYFDKWNKEKTIQNVKTELEKKNRTIVKVFLTGINIIEKNRIIGRKDILRDMSEMLSLQKQARKYQYKSLYDQSQYMYRTVNSRGVILDCNESYAKKLGYQKEEVIGAHVLDHTSRGSIITMTNNMKNWRIDDVLGTTKISMKTKNGIEFPVVLTPKTIYDENGRLFGRQVVIRDQSLFDTKEKILTPQDIDKKKDEFISKIAHELRTPLGIIKLSTEALMKPKMLGELNKEQYDTMENISEYVLRLEVLVETILNNQRLELGKLKFKHEEIDIQQFIENLFKIFKLITNDRHIKLNIGRTRTHIKGDKTLIQLILENLIFNAIDFVEEEKGKIIIDAKSRGRFVLFSVTDNGIGIPKNKLKNIFTKFYQADYTQTRTHGGSGLGLSVCDDIVQGLGGKIWVQSQKEKNTTFFFTVPKQ